MKKILIAGGTGYLGSFLTETLSSYEVTSFGSNECDLLSDKSINEYFSDKTRYDLVIFLVGLAHKKGKKNDFNEFNELNFKTLKNLMDYFKKNKIIPNKLIFSSTISIYGENKNISSYNEDITKNPVSPYARTKQKAENFLIENYSSNSWILRLAPCYSSSFKKNIYRRIKIGKVFYQISKGNRKLSLCSFKNIDVTVKGIISDLVPRGIYNLSDKHDYQYKDLIKWANPKNVIKIPYFIVLIAYIFGKTTRSFFFMENSIKLLTDNIYSSKKIRNYLKLDNNLFSVTPND